MKSLFYLTIASFTALLSSSCTTANKTPAKSSYYIDVHELGAGKVTAAAVAAAHQKDLAVQHKHDVRFIEYWVDEEHGNVYCLSEAKNPSSIAATHREAHGLMPSKILPVSSGEAATHQPGTTLFLDVHELGAGNVTADAVAAAHQKDLAVQAKHGVRFLNYWVDEANGKVVCLSEAPSADAVRETHQEAHGLLPASIVKVERGE